MMEIHSVLKWLTAEEDFRFHFIYLLWKFQLLYWRRILATGFHSHRSILTWRGCFFNAQLLLLLVNVLTVEIGVVKLCLCHPVAHFALCLGYLLQRHVVQSALEYLVFVFWNCCFISQAIENVFSIGKKYPINPHGDAVLNYECFCTPFNGSSVSENINWTSLSKEECLVSNPQICIWACKIIVLLEVHINQCQAWSVSDVTFKLIWRWQVRASSYNSNKLTYKMQQFYKLITWRFVSLNMFRSPPRPSSGAYNCINSLWFYLGAWW